MTTRDPHAGWRGRRRRRELFERGVHRHRRRGDCFVIGAMEFLEPRPGRAVSLQEGEDRIRLCTRRHRWNARDGGRSAGGESAAQH
jgi:hypothetical protein